MRWITADYIFPVSSPPIKAGIVVIDDDGTIVEIGNSAFNTRHSALEKYEGIICPGFINTHCHLELSYMKKKIKEKTGLDGFIKEFVSVRSKSSKEKILKSIREAEREMIKNGIVAVGDISNDSSTFAQKAKGNLHYHTFIEVFDLGPEKAGQEFQKGLQLIEELKNIPLQSHKSLRLPSFSDSLTHKRDFLTQHFSIVPHAPYSVSEKLFKMIEAYANANNSILSIHNQETKAENELFISKTGKLFDLFSSMGISLDHIKKTGFNSLRSTLSQLPKGNKILLVHNTYTSREDIKWTHNSAFSTQQSQLIYWCMCPNANLYIENKLPDYDAFISENAKITIGTDSYASNRSLSVLDEMKTISKHFSAISLETLMIWATKNGAEFLGFDDQLGTIEKGKKPGLNLIKKADLQNLKLTENSEVEVLV